MRTPDFLKIIVAAMMSLCLSGMQEASAKTFDDWVPKNGEELDFKVLRNGKPFGHHRVTFEVEGTKTIVQNDIELKVSLGPVRLFYYGHESTEVWSGAKLVSLKGQTRKDGETLTVNAFKEGESLKVKNSEGAQVIPEGIIPSSHWNIDEIRSTEILSSEDGSLLPVEVENLGQETIETANGEVNANRYRLKSALSVDLWYDKSGRWVKARFEARGQTIDYVLQ